jgi:hypothetical protein
MTAFYSSLITNVLLVKGELLKKKSHYTLLRSEKIRVLQAAIKLFKLGYTFSSFA